MTVFWLGAAVMLIAGLGWVLPALWTRDASRSLTRDEFAVAAYEQRAAELKQDFQDGVIDADQLASAEDDLAAELLNDYKNEADSAQSQTRPMLTAGVLGLATAAFAGAVYFELGEPAALGISGKGTPRVAPAQAAGPQGAGPQGATPQGQSAMPSIEEMVGSLAKRLESEPEDGTGWMMLGRSYTVLGRLEEAESALQKAVQLLPDEPDALAAYAEVLGRRNNNDLRGKPTDLLKTALQKRPTHAKTLWLTGIAAMQRGDRVEAVRYWEQLRATGALNAEELQSLDRFIAEAQGQSLPAGAPPPAQTAAVAAPSPQPAVQPPSPSTPSSASKPAGQGVSITVSITLSEALRAKVATGDSLFVFARAANGPPMPLAVQRLSAGALPAEVTLDESMAMMPQFNLSAFDPIVVGARISKSGNAQASPGDMQGLSAPLSPSSTKRVEVVIGETIGQ